MVSLASVSLHVVGAQREVTVFYGIALIAAKQADVRSGRAYVKGDMVTSRRTRREVAAFLLLLDHGDRAFSWQVDPPSPVQPICLGSAASATGPPLVSKVRRSASPALHHLVHSSKALSQL